MAAAIQPFEEAKDAEEVVLPEAEAVASERRIRVLLPSGKILRCSGSVMIRHSPLLRKHAAELLCGILHLEYGPPEAFRDQDVVGFISMLHQQILGIQDSSRGQPVQWYALQHALGVSLDLFFDQLFPDTTPAARDAFLRIGVLQLFCADDKRWREPFLELLATIPAESLKEFLSAEYRPTLKEILRPEDLIAIAYSRWKQESRPAFYRPPCRVRPNTHQSRSVEDEIVLKPVQGLPSYLQVKIVVNDSCALICDASRMERWSAVVREALLQTTDAPATVAIRIPDGVFDTDVVRQAFGFFHGECSTPAKLPLLLGMCCIHIAHLLEFEPAICGNLAYDVWQPTPSEYFWEWVATTRLPIMQQARPPNVSNTISAEEVSKLLRQQPEVDILAHRLSYLAEHPSALGLEMLLDQLYNDPC